MSEKSKILHQAAGFDKADLCASEGGRPSHTIRFAWKIIVYDKRKQLDFYMF